MMLRAKCKGLAFLAMVWLLLFSTVASANGTWRLDGTGTKELPRDFHASGDAWHIDPEGEEPPRRELESLHISGSAQPSLGGLSVLYGKLRGIAPDAGAIYLVDLRQESHGFADQVPVSWYEEKNRANLGKNAEAVEKEEEKLLHGLLGHRTTFVPLGTSDKARLRPQTFQPRAVRTEKEAAEAAGFHYVRFAATDMVWPDADTVERFLEFAANLPENAWLHFHCHAGHGRTTTFMVMYDILRNSDVDLDDVVRRQYLQGGSNLFAESNG